MVTSTIPYREIHKVLISDSIDKCYTDSWSASPCAVGGNTQAFVTTSTDALGHQGKTQYNSCSTLAEKFQDQNDINAARWGKTATYDKMYRPVTITNADGGGSTFTYNDAVPYTTTNATKLDTARSVVSQTIKDGIGRLRKAILTAPEGSIYGFSTYDALGRRQFQWNPTKCDPEFNSSCAGENTFGKTETQYDALSRPIKVIHPDNGFASTSYAANCVTVTDEASKARKACTDALGNLTNVWEDPAGLNYQTDYQYDVLGNLKRVDQKGSAPSDSSQWRTRLFTYNSVSELLTANNPESGIITYGYNADGSLASRVAPAPNQLGSSTVTTTYVYDALHRLTDRYSSNPVWVAFRYDDPAFWGLPTVESVGRMVFAEEVPDGTNPTSQRFFAYDTVGRIKTVWDRRDQNLQPDITSALYDYAGNLTSFTYPSTRQVTYGYDTASRLTNVKFANFGVTPVNYDYLNVSNFHPTGAPKISNFGNATAETTTYNPRLQISGINVINASGPLLDKSYDYGSANNGNIMAINDGLDGNKTQSFIYDALNRITSGQSAATTGADAWGQSFAVDAWGNLTAQTQTKGSPPPFNAAANTKNQLVGYAYDAAGNMTNDGSHSYFYNSDNMITSADSGASTYTYDANANRVRKTTGSNLTEYLYFGSNVVAEKDQTGAWTDYVFAGGKRIVQATGSTSAGSKYFHADHLGSSRMMTDSAGTNIWSATYLPYGWEYNASGNSTHFKFSGKERDTETGLDYFGARYYSSGSGHWTSIDPVLVTPTRMLDPQRFNLYNYSRGNPLEYVDPDGKDINLVNDTQQGREQALATITKNMTEQEAANIDVRQNKDGKWEVYVKDPNAISAGDASVGYKGITGVISDHSIVANVGLIGGGLSATFSDIGKISSFSEGSAVIAPSPGSKQVSVIVTQGDHPGGVQVYCCNGRGVYQGRSPDFVTMYHELVGETLKYRAGHESLQNDPVRDSKTVIKIENEIRAFHNMNPRTGVGHGQTVITVTPQ
jgi:RHS repeat-associated protein